MTIAAKIRAWRLHRDLTRRDLAARAGAPVASIQDWENGRRTPSALALMALSQALGCDLEDLVPEVEVPRPWTETDPLDYLNPYVIRSGPEKRRRREGVQLDEDQTPGS